MNKIDEIKERYLKAKESDDPIAFYTRDTSNCRNLKILMDPFETLKNMAIKPKQNPYNKNLIGFLKSQNVPTEDIEKEINGFNELFTQKTFIKEKQELDLYISNLEQILKKAYINYYNFNKLPSKLYRSVNTNELNFLNKSRTINALFSTTKDLQTCKEFTIETAELEWDPEEHHIIELSLKGRIPFIDVDKDSFKVFEPNEVILVNPFTVTKPILTKKGSPNAFGFYTMDTIPEYSSIIKHIESNPTNIDMEDINELYEQVRNGIGIYGTKIEQLLNYEIDNKLFNNVEYREWAKKLSKMINMLQNHIEYYVLRDKEPKTLIKR